jgi:hypothetical protein
MILVIVILFVLFILFIEICSNFSFKAIKVNNKSEKLSNNIESIVKLDNYVKKTYNKSTNIDFQGELIFYDDVDIFINSNKKLSPNINYKFDEVENLDIFVYNDSVTLYFKEY